MLPVLEAAILDGIELDLKMLRDSLSERATFGKSEQVQVVHGSFSSP